MNTFNFILGRLHVLFQDIVELTEEQKMHCTPTLR